MRARNLLRVSSLLVIAACGPGTVQGNGDGGHGGDAADPSTILTVTPPTATVLVTNGTPATQVFTAKDSHGTDLTSVADWSLGDIHLGSIVHGVYTAATPLPYGGQTVVIASSGSKSGSAVLTVVYVGNVVDPSAPPTAPGDFGGPPSTNPGETPVLVYPFTGTMLARNINQMNLQWTGNGTDTEYKIHLVGPTVDQSFYVGAAVCGGGTQCSYKPQDADWQAVAQSATGSKVTLTIQGTAGPGAPVATSTQAELNFSPDDVKGGLYYFSTSAQGIKRLPFGASQALDFLGQTTTGQCVGCHAITRDGARLTAETPYADQQGIMVDGANASNVLVQPDGSKLWNFETFSPDGTQMVTNWAGMLELRDGVTGNLIMQIPQSYYGAKQAVMPAWSPDGQSLAFVGIPPEGLIGKDNQSGFGLLTAGDWILANAGDIMVMPVNGGAFGPAHVVVPSVPMSEYNFYPDWSPDSQWIVFATGVWPGSSPTAAFNGVDTTNKTMSYDQDSARLRLVAAGGGTPIELVAATHQMQRTSTWPKFAPFEQNGGKLVFLTFSSKFAYGFVVPDGARPQIWMSALDLSNPEFGGDPSYPPFWLPFQDPSQNNHETIWTEKVGCTGPQDCPGEFTCDMGQCVPTIGKPTAPPR